MAVRKVTVNLPDDAVTFLQELAEREQITFTEALRRSIKAERFFVEQEAAGRKILVEDKDKKIREVMRAG
jgi:glutamine phosphoribosylpyrophosphate amidotransferase